MDREDAEIRSCETCSARPGQTCRNVHTGEPVTLWPAHLARLRTSSSAPPMLPRSAVLRPPARAA